MGMSSLFLNKIFFFLSHFSIFSSRCSSLPRQRTYDFGYLLKVLTCEALPEEEPDFHALLKLVFFSPPFWFSLHILGIQHGPLSLVVLPLPVRHQILDEELQDVKRRVARGCRQSGGAFLSCFLCGHFLRSFGLNSFSLLCLCAGGTNRPPASSWQRQLADISVFFQAAQAFFRGPDR